MKNIRIDGIKGYKFIKEISKEGSNKVYLATKIEDGKYYVDENGKWVKGKTSESTDTSESTGTWKKDSKGWWYQYADGTYPKNAWAKINGKWYHFDASGYMQTGWYKEGNYYYYLKADGSMACDEYVVDGKYYIDSNGHWVE